MVHRCFPLLLVVSATVGQLGAGAGSLRKVWDLDLRKAIDEIGAKHTPDLPVFALRFAPDGGRVAAIVDLYGSKGAEKSYLIVIDARHPKTNFLLFEVSGKLNYDENGPDTDNFGWSPSGQTIYAGGTVISLEQGNECKLPWRSFFFTDTFAVAEDPVPLDWNALTSHFTFFDRRCQLEGKWDVPEKWVIKDTSPDRVLLSVSRLLRFPDETEQLIVNPLSRQVIHRWSGSRMPTGQFADSGTAICGGSDVEAAEHAPVTCWDVDSSRKINEAPTINGGDPISPALHASRVIASDYRRRKMLLSSDYMEIFKRRVVWDFRSGKELLSWRPQFQSWDFQLDLDPSKPFKHVHEPFRFAISPDGEYVVEGGNGGVHLYKIVP